jgi:hypothetical protein
LGCILISDLGKAIPVQRGPFQQLRELDYASVIGKAQNALPFVKEQEQPSPPQPQLPLQGQQQRGLSQRPILHRQPFLPMQAAPPQ